MMALTYSFNLFRTGSKVVRCGKRPFSLRCGGRTDQRLLLAGGEETKADDSGEDEGDAEEAEGRGMLVEEEDAEDDGADGSDAGPDGVGSAEGKGADSESEESHGEDDGDYGEDGGEEAGEALGVLHADGPGDLHNAGDDEDGPGHGSSP